MTTSVLIKGGKLPDGSHSDVAIADGVISAIGSDLPTTNPTVIDGKDCVVLPGLVDLHTHL